MTVALVVRAGAGAAVVQAFSEELAAGITLDAEEDPQALVALARAADVERVVPASAGAVAASEQLALALGLAALAKGSAALRTHRLRQREAVGPLAGAGWSVRSAAALAELVAAQGTLLVTPACIGDEDPRWICRDAAAAARAWGALAASGELLATRDGGGHHYGIDTVSDQGRAVVVDIHAHRIDERDGQLRLRHRSAVPGGNELALRLGRFASECLEAVGIRDGAAHVEVELLGDVLRLVEVLASGSGCPVPADAAFRAYGYSQAHVLAEQVLRPLEFARRLRRPPPRNGSTVAIAPLRVWRDGTLPRAEGLRLLRRLGGFHSLTQLAEVGSPVCAGDIVGWAAFVSDDADWLHNSLTVLHEIEDTHSLFIEHLDVIDLSSNVA